MTTTVLPDNTVKIPDAIAQLLDLKPGATLDWQVADNATLIIHKHSTRGTRADKLLGIARPFLKPGEGAIAELVRQRTLDDEQGMDCQASAHGHPRVFELAIGKSIDANITIPLFKKRTDLPMPT